MRLWSLFFMLFALLGRPAAAQARGPLVLAAASMQEALGEAADRWAARGHPRPVLSFAASSALARQIGAGAPADLFVSADDRWMEWLAEKGRLVPGTRAVLAGNRLVVVAAPGRGQELGGMRGRALGTLLAAGPFAMGDPAAVPAGRYGKTALERLGAWPMVARRVVRGESVRAALSLVERGAAPYGIVYATDARIAPRLRIVGRFPPGSHPPVHYPVARLVSARHPDAEGFRRFLLSPAGQSILVRHGFTRP